MRRQRWSDHDRYLGPFTLAYPDRAHGVGVMLDSGHDEYPGCHVRFYCYWFTLLLALPPILPPYKERHWPQWDAATVERLGRDWYDEEFAREFGFNVVEGTLHVRYGRQTHDSSTDQSRCFFLPWTQWTFVRHSLYDTAGEHYWTEPPRTSPDHRNSWDVKDDCPAVSFSFDDFDGERITARTVIEEREWHFGEGAFRWLRWFRRPKITRGLDIAFSAETGRRKGSWKGGTVGHSIALEPGELHESAFRRYCAEHEMTFVARV